MMPRRLELKAARRASDENCPQPAAGSWRWSGTYRLAQI